MCLRILSSPWSNTSKRGLNTLASTRPYPVEFSALLNAAPMCASISFLLIICHRHVDLELSTCPAGTEFPASENHPNEAILCASRVEQTLLLEIFVLTFLILCLSGHQFFRHPILQLKCVKLLTMSKMLTAIACNRHLNNFHSSRSCTVAENIPSQYVVRFVSRTFYANRGCVYTRVYTVGTSGFCVVGIALLQ